MSDINSDIGFLVKEVYLDDDPYFVVNIWIKCGFIPLYFSPFQYKRLNKYKFSSVYDWNDYFKEVLDA